MISGYDGGTGASPLSSVSRWFTLGIRFGRKRIKLFKHKLRQRVTVQTDGQIKTGRDILMATLMGAEEWGIAASALIVQGVF